MLPPLFYFSDVIIDASIPNVVRDGGQMWNKADKLEEVGAKDFGRKNWDIELESCPFDTLSHHFITS